MFVLVPGFLHLLFFGSVMALGFDYSFLLVEANAMEWRLGSELSLHPEFYPEANGLR